MIKLFIDTTISKKAIVTLYKGEKKIAYEESGDPLTAIENLLKKRNLTIEEVEVLDSHPGPGSFTGLRIGASVAQAINFAKGKKIKGSEIHYD